MKLLLIRHGETIEGKKGTILGQLPGNLSVKGKKMAKAITKALKKSELSPEIILSSDLNRAKQTTEIINKELKLPVKYLKILRERHAGIAQGKKDEEISWNIYEKKPLMKRKHAGGESFTDVKARVNKFLKDLKTRKEGSILIASHNVFLILLISEMYKIPFERAKKFSFENKICIVDKKRGARQSAPAWLTIKSDLNH